SAVEFEPAPAITGARPAAVCTHSSTTRRCSSWLRVEVSPVVPTGTSPCTPAAIWRSTSHPNAPSSRPPPAPEGVTGAVKTPRNRERVMAQEAVTSPGVNRTVWEAPDNMSSERAPATRAVCLVHQCVGGPLAPKVHLRRALLSAGCAFAAAALAVAGG